MRIKQMNTKQLHQLYSICMIYSIQKYSVLLEAWRKMTMDIPFGPAFLFLLRNRFHLPTSVLILIHILSLVGLFYVATVSTCVTTWKKRTFVFEYTVLWSGCRLEGILRISLHLIDSWNAELGILTDEKLIFITNLQL